MIIGEKDVPNIWSRKTRNSTTTTAEDNIKKQEEEDLK
jgi:hypothetical protein